jgi:dTDP-4-dehydrorhamnose reductase
MTPKTLLLTGATGFLGKRLAAGLSGAWSVLRASRGAEGPGAAPLDLLDPDSVRRAFDRARPAAVVHAAAVAGPDDCEREPEVARRVNAEATRLIAELCGRSGARLVHFSTDLVFDGEKGWYSEDDPPNPISVYGRTKLAAEEAALNAAPGACVLRVASVYGRPLGTRPCYIDELRAALSRGEPVSAFADQWRTPTLGDQLPEVVLRLLADPGLEGVYHWAGADRVTRYESALQVCRTFGYDERLVRAARTADRRFLAPRPRDTSLESGRLAADIGLAPPTLLQGLAALKAAA